MKAMTGLSFPGIRRSCSIAALLAIFLALSPGGYAQTWTPLNNPPGFSPSNALLLTNGTVMVQAADSGNWWRLTPDNTGSYVNGSWSQLASIR